MAYGALGGGTFTVQNKVLPGTYTKMISQPKMTSVWQDRGFATIALPLDWGEEGKIVTLTRERLLNNAVSLLGHAYNDPELKPVRDILKGAKVLHLYNLNGGGSKASVTAGSLKAEAVYPGVSGNSISLKVEAVLGAEKTYRVVTYFNGREMDIQTIKKLEDFKKNGLITLSGTLDDSSKTVMSHLENGKNGTVTGGAHDAYLKAIQGEYFNVIAYAGDDEGVKSLYESFIKTQVYDVGYMAQLVVHKSKTANDRFITNLWYDAVGEGENAYDSIYWYLGKSAGVELGRSVSASLYDGEYEVEAVTDAFEAEDHIKKGHLVMMKSDGDIKILEDINSLTSFTKEITEDWTLNEIVRIVIQRVQNISMLFNKYYMHKELNDDIGRSKLWADIAWSAKEQFQRQLRIIEDYKEEDTQVMKGEQKGGVVIYDAITPVVTMSKLYLTVAIA